MKKSLGININFTNRFIYTFVAFIVLLVIGIGVFALTPGIAPNPGHLIDNVAPPASCQTNQVLQWDGVDWICANSSSAAPSGAVMAFNLATCPTGWSEFTSARGRYLVGLPSSGTLAATVGTALTDQENRPVGQHSHSITDPGHSHSFTQAGGGSSGAPHSAGGQAGSSTTGGSSTGISVNSFGTTAGTNAPYIQLLICQKS